jgi:2-polyprenyl-6-methoxyphenol hydroxylase-like FAD-dependent oxidoreductase
MSSKYFHAIIVGGGPTGLSLAHAFLKANIAFTLLERREDIVEFTGATLGIWGHNVRVLDRFDVL